MPLFKKIIILSCVFAFLSFAQTALAAIEGKVIAITDGDTLKVVDHKNIQHKIRLVEIDTPEKGQPYGQKAKDALSDLVFGKMVRVDVVTTDKYGRLVGHIYLNDLHVNKEMVRLGAAWAYRQYLKDKSFLDIEEEARAAKRGLWALSEAQNVPPWEWRKQQRQQTTSTAKTDTSCGHKQYCKEMTSCAEAKFYLNSCGLERLDGNKDGVPCEALCR